MLIVWAFITWVIFWKVKKKNSFFELLRGVQSNLKTEIQNILPRKGFDQKNYG